MVKYVENLREIADQFDAFLIDQFGVLLDGVGAYPQAIRSLDLLAQLGKPIILLSNSGKRTAPNVERLLRLGFNRKSFDTVLTSGEVAWHWLAKQIANDAIPISGRVFSISRDGDESAFEGLGLKECYNIDEADIFLISGSEGDKYSFDHYLEILSVAAKNQTIALCSNPDHIMLTAQGMSFGAGKIAEAYAQLGGNVTMIGKPFPEIYNQALTQLSGIRPGSILAIGDSPDHDIKGARQAGMKTCHVRSGVHNSKPGDETADFTLSEFLW